MSGYYNATTERAPATFAHGGVLVNTFVTQIAAARPTRRSILVQNLSTADIYVGGPDVTTTNGPNAGIKVIPGADLTLYTEDAVYAIATSNGADVRYLEEYNG